MNKAMEIQLEHGTLKLIPLMGGKLILAEKINGTTTKGEVLASLKKVGITQGILSECITLLPREDIQQMPVARAYYQDEPPKFEVHFGPKIKEQVIGDILEGKSIDLIDDRLLVKKDFRLVSLTKPFRTILRFPDGKSLEKSELDFRNLSVFAGTNTKARDDAIYAAAEGSAFLSKWGVVHVHPVLTIKGLGEIHGRVDDQIAVKVQEDIHAHSALESPSNIFVLGMIHSSYIQAAGYVQALDGIDNTKRSDNSRIISGKSIFTSYVKNYRLIAKEKILVYGGIHQSIVISHDEVISNFIESSEIRVRNRLLTNHIRGNTRIYLGAAFFRDEAFKQRILHNQQKERQLSQKEFLIEEMRDRLEREKIGILKYLARLREEGKDKIFIDSTLTRLYNALKGSLVKLQIEIKDYERQLAEYFTQKMLLSYYIRESSFDESPQIRVLGKIDAGVIITAPNQVVKLTNPLEDVTIILDRYSGKIHFKR